MAVTNVECRLEAVGMPLEITAWWRPLPRELNLKLEPESLCTVKQSALAMVSWRLFLALDAVKHEKALWLPALFFLIKGCPDAVLMTIAPHRRHPRTPESRLD